MQDFLIKNISTYTVIYFCNNDKYQEWAVSKSVDSTIFVSTFSDNIGVLALISVAIAIIPTSNHKMGSKAKNFFIYQIYTIKKITKVLY